MTPPRIVILGAGPAGLGAAFRLSRRGAAHVTVLERNGWVGGNAGSFDVGGCRVDYGSHRLHPACDPAVLADIRALLADDLLDRPRHGRIRLQGRWIHFPLKPLDLVRRLPWGFVGGIALDAARKAFRPRQPAQPETFASILEAGLGPTICREFYFPYARKVWGLPPEELAATQARRRVSAGSLTKMLRKVWSAVPGVRRRGSGRFFYPRHGYGQISEAYRLAAERAGADIQLDARIVGVTTRDSRVTEVEYERAGAAFKIAADHVWSTIPITALARCLRPLPPEECLRAVDSLEYRAMILVYLVLEQDRFSDFDAHYFPESDIPIARISEPKNYSGGHGPADVTVLCAELPCDANEAVWALSDEDLAKIVRGTLERVGLPIQAVVKEVVTRRLRYAYPLYRRTYQEHLQRLDDWIGGVDGLLTFGRQGLFTHDNTHHALFMAYSAVECLTADGAFDRVRWADFRRVFDTHVVED
jgi:protoporphyrinogen oxidase